MLAREGYAAIAATAAAASLAAYFLGVTWSAPLWGLGAYLVYVFYERRPVVPPSPLAVVSPAAGRVTQTGQLDDPWLGRRARHVRVRVDAPGVTVLRSPTEGKVMDYWTSPHPFGAEPAEAREGASPNCYALWVRTDEGDDVVWVVSSLTPVSRFKCDVAPGQRVGQGQRHCFVYFGSYVDLLLPLESKVEVSVGDRVHGGSAVIARLVHA